MVPASTRVRRFTARLLAVSMCVGVVSTGTSSATGRADCSLAPTSGTVSRSAAGRAYHVNVPPGLSGPPVPLLLSLHGALQPYSVHERETRWSTAAATGHFIVAYPSATGLAWDAAQGSGDVAYLREVVEDISSTWCVDPRRVHAEGFSSGANMSARLACDAPEVFASVAAYAGVSPSFTGSPCAPDRPIAVALFHSDGDLISLPPFAVAHRDEWLHRNGCPTTPVTEPGVPPRTARAGQASRWCGGSTAEATSGPRTPTAPTSPPACGTSSCATNVPEVRPQRDSTAVISSRLVMPIFR